MLMELFILLFLMGFGALGLGIWKRHLIPTILAVIIFGVLAFQSFGIEYVSAGATVDIQEPIFSLLSWLFMFISFIVCLIAVVSMLRNKDDNKQGYQMGM